MKKMFSFFTVLLLIYLGLLAVMYSFQEKLIFFPEKLPADHKFSYKAKEISIESEDVRINTLLFEKKKTNGLILYFHGNAGSLESWGSVSSDFMHLPYDLLVIDFRGYGKSTGTIQNEAQLHKDALAIHKKMSEKYKKIIIYGRSIGTGVASELATKHKPEMLILETPYFNLPDLVGGIYPFVPGFLVKYKLRNDLNIVKLDCPVHLIHGTQDELIPTSSSVRLSELDKKFNLHIIKGAGHNNISAFKQYHETLKDIFSAK